MSIAILGCGPAGLLATHAAVVMGHDDIDIISIKRKSLMPGAQYLHEHLPGTPDRVPDGVLRYVKRGDRDSYALKVYGDATVPCSWDTFEEGTVSAWSMQKLYDWLWERYQHLIIDNEVSDGVLDAITNNGSYEAVLSSIPLWCLCRKPGEHEFISADVYISPVCAERDLPPNTIVYNGDLDDEWYRTSRIFGHESTESTRPMLGAIEGRKPIGNDCDCRPGITRIGRFGKWQKGVLVHSAYYDTHRALSELTV